MSVVSKKLVLAALTGLVSAGAMSTGLAYADSHTVDNGTAMEKSACKGKSSCKTQSGEEKEKHACKGMNSCKGQGADGKNECKGKGSCRTDQESTDDAVNTEEQHNQ